MVFIFVFFIGFFKFMEYLFINGYYFELLRKNDYSLILNRKCIYLFVKSGLVYLINYGMNFLFLENIE